MHSQIYQKRKSALFALKAKAFYPAKGTVPFKSRLASFSTSFTKHLNDQSLKKSEKKAKKLTSFYRGEFFL